MNNHKEKAIIGCIIGTAIGDAIALPLEGLSKQRQLRCFPEIHRHNLLFGKGMISDDTEHTCMVGQSLIYSAGDGAKFSHYLSWELRWWLLLPGGIGFATLRAICKLWLGFPPHKSGVFSAGNGPAMRSAIIGVCYGNDLVKLRQLIKISTIITHSDPKAEYGAFAVAIAAFLSSQNTPILPNDYYNYLLNTLPGEDLDFLSLIQSACLSAELGESSEKFAIKIGNKKGISGYIYHTVAVVIQTWLRHQTNYRDGILEIMRCGGDTDTIAAILGGIIGAKVGKDQIPKDWINNLWEYPRNIKWMERLGKRLAEVCESGITQKPLFLPVWWILLRNLLFILVIIFHGFRRLLPPY